MKLIQACSATIHEWLPFIRVKVAFRCEKCPVKDHFIYIPTDATARSILSCEHAQNSCLTTEQQYWMKVSNIPERDDLTDAQLQGVADAVQRTGKLKELADALEVVPLLKALEEEEETKSTLKLLQHWHRGLKGSLGVHSILVHHLRCIGLEGTADKLLYSTLQSNTVSSSTVTPTAFQSNDKVTSAELRACARYISGDLLPLAYTLGVPEDEVKSIQSRFKSAQLQAQHMLKYWQSVGERSKQELADILTDAGFVDAAQILQATDEPLLRDLLEDVKTTKWYYLGLQLDISSHDLDIIEHDTNRFEDRLRQMFQKWLKICEKPSWRMIVNAVRTIGEKGTGK